MSCHTWTLRGDTKGLKDYVLIMTTNAQKWENVNESKGFDLQHKQENFD